MKTGLPAAAVTATWAAYLFVLPFHRMWMLPWLGEKLQPPEVVFLGLAAAATVLWWQGRVRWRFRLADAGVAMWVGANLLAFVLSDRESRAVVQTLGVVYLACLYAAVRMTAAPRLLDRFGGWFGYSAAIAALIGIAGSVASSMGLSTRLATLAATPVPYLGQAARAQAFTTGPQMLASILLLAIPLFIGSRLDRAWRRRDSVVVLVLILGLLATVSKTALCLIAALSVMWAAGASPGQAPRPRYRAWAAAAAALAVALVFTVGSHVMVMKAAAVSSMTDAQLVGGRPLAEFSWRREPWVVMPTSYYFNKQASLLAIARSWPIGVGPAGQPAFTSKLKQEGRFPSSIWLTDPHSTYLGTVAELGVLGLAALVIILAAGVSTIRRLLNGPRRMHWEAAAYAGAGVAFLIEAISTDLFNCRHYWFLLAVMAARLDSVSAGAHADRSTD